MVKHVQFLSDKIVPRPEIEYQYVFFNAIGTYKYENPRIHFGPSGNQQKYEKPMTIYERIPKVAYRSTDNSS
jgi:hypothetical protein